MKTITTIVGARPQFIKCAPVARVLRQSCKEILIHTGQHYDYNMSQSFFDELAIPEPDFNLGIGSGLHGEQTGRMLTEIEKVLLEIKPDWVLIYGDTNSTMAGALAAAKLQIPVAHVEAGLRSFNRAMPEEINRIVADSVSQLLFTPTQTAVDHLRREGITAGVHLVGDVMFDSFLFNLSRIDAEQVLTKYQVQPRDYILATIHRPQNTDDPAILARLIASLQHLSQTVLLPIHPRTRHLMHKHGIENQSAQLRLIDPVAYLEMIALEKNAGIIITDSGGVQKEAYFAGVPCLVLRGETEWVELVEHGWATLLGFEFDRIPAAIEHYRTFHGSTSQLFGDGQASQQIGRVILGDPR